MAHVRESGLPVHGVRMTWTHVQRHVQRGERGLGGKIGIAALQVLLIALVFLCVVAVTARAQSLALVGSGNSAVKVDFGGGNTFQNDVVWSLRLSSASGGSARR